MKEQILIENQAKVIRAYQARREALENFLCDNEHTFFTADDLLEKLNEIDCYMYPIILGKE